MNQTFDENATLSKRDTVWLRERSMPIETMVIELPPAITAIWNGVSGQQCDHTTHPPVVENGDVG